MKQIAWCCRGYPWKNTNAWTNAVLKPNLLQNREFWKSFYEPLTCYLLPFLNQLSYRALLSLDLKNLGRSFILKRMSNMDWISDILPLQNLFFYFVKKILKFDNKIKLFQVWLGKRTIFFHAFQFNLTLIPDQAKRSISIHLERAKIDDRVLRVINNWT